MTEVRRQEICKDNFTSTPCSDAIKRLTMRPLMMSLQVVCRALANVNTDACGDGERALKKPHFVNRTESITTLPSDMDLQDADHAIRDILLLILGVIGIHYVAYFLESPVETLLSKLITVRSEYEIGEQLSKLYLFVTVLLSAFSYRTSVKPHEVKLSIAFLLLGLVMYMSESNMITEETQPLFGFLAIVCTVFFLLRLRSWLSLVVFVLGFLFVSLGSMVDLIYEHESIYSLVPGFIESFLHRGLEERCEGLGAAFVCLSALLSFRTPLGHLIVKDGKRSLLLLVSAGLMTSGNGFLHYQYGPGGKLYGVALVMTIVGFLGLVFVGKALTGTYPSRTSVGSDLFYVCAFFIFVVMPSIHGHARSTAALLLWLPAMVFLGLYLWHQHSARRGSLHETKARP